MRHRLRVAILTLSVLGWSTAWATPAAAARPLAAFDHCSAEQSPTFSGDTARLHTWIGSVVGDPTSCPDDDPSADALEVGGCQAVLAAYTAGEDFPTGFAWSGQVSPLGTFDGSAVAACLSTESFAGGNAIWCLLADDRPAAIDGGDACLALVSLVREDDRTLLGTAHASAALNVVRRLRWTGGGFDVVDEFESCTSTPPTSVPPAIADDVAAVASYCHYPN